ncbi:MAG TPA: hypothetical protein DDY98_03295 [Ruminococcaceae bacterium]|nr:hypothetical protein [Oscillospiraceae bacterium]
MKSFEKTYPIIGRLLFGVMLALLLTAVFGMACFSVMRDTSLAVRSFIFLFVLLFALILYVGCRLGKHDNQGQKRLFESMIVLSFFSTFFGMAVGFFNGTAQLRVLTLTVQVLSNILLAVFWLVFWRYQKSNYPRYDTEMIVDWMLVVYMSIYILFSCMNFFVPVLFSVSSDGFVYYRADYFTLTYLSLWYLFYIGYVFTRKCSGRIKLTLSSYVLFPLTLNAAAFLLFQNADFQNLYHPLNNLCFLIPLYLIYFNLHIENSRKLAQQREELTAARINLMVSQIQPHFIYNSLTAIIDLIDKSPEQAKESIVDFSDYLRVNLDSLKEVRLIPFDKELQHCKTYLRFEQLRFENITVNYDIRVSSFLLPALTVQPLVENAVKHGISKTGAGGTVTIATEETQGAVQILISDDGVGYDAAEITDGVHVGLDNVRKRLADLCGGKLEIKGEKNVGTLVTVTLPKEGV